MITLKRHEQREYADVTITDGFYPAVLTKVKEAEKSVYQKPNEKEPIYRLIFSVTQDDGTEAIVIKDLRPSIAFKPKTSGLAQFLRAVTGESDNTLIGLTDAEVEQLLNKSCSKKFMVDVVVNDYKGKRYAKVDKIKLDKSEDKITLEDLYESDTTTTLSSDSDEIPF